MKNYTVCILDKDIYYAQTFMKVVALEHAGVGVRARTACGEGCADEIDVCIGFGAGDTARETCEKAFEPRCGKYAGVASILCEAGKYVVDREIVSVNETVREGGRALQTGAALFKEGTLLCVHAFAGGLGTSCAAIGIGRELARYRDEQVMYLSLEDAEDAGLFPAELRAMRAEEALYRYLRLLNTGAGREGFERLYRAAAARDEYGLYRMAPDDGAGSLACLTPHELYSFLTSAADTLGLSKIVLDFGTRLNFLKQFAALLCGEALFIEVSPEAGNPARKKRGLLPGERILMAVFPFCEEDIRQKGGYTDIGIANAFGLAVKELCDRITEDIQ